MIKKLGVFNFQNHKSTLIDFVDGVNVIIGKSDSGKSAIVRALNWMVNNKPKGDSFCSFWGGKTKISLSVFDEGYDDIKISRVKGNKDNSYLIDSEKYTALKGSVPNDVKEIINLSDINFQFQFDASFLFSASSGEVARYFNKIIHLDNIDFSLQNISRTYAQEKNRIEEKKQELTSLRESLARYKWIKEADIRISIVEVENTALNEKMEDLKELNRIIANVKEKIRKKKEIDKRLVYEEEIQRLIGDCSLVEKEEYKLSKLQELIVSIDSLTDKKKNMREEMNILERGFNKAFPKICPLCEQLIRRDK